MRFQPHLAFAVVLAIAVSGVSPLHAQDRSHLMPPDPPWETYGSSARWWTLSDEITPEQLRSIHGDAELHRQRFTEAVLAGSRRLLSEERMELLTYFVAGESHPELFPMWVPFDSFSGDFFREREVHPVDSMVEFGLKGKMLETIARFARGYWGERQNRVQDHSKRVEESVAFANMAAERMTPPAFEAAVRAGEASPIARATGHTVAQVEAYFEIWRRPRKPAEEYAVETLPRLRSLLGPIGWEKFRAYLLEVKAPYMVTITAAVDDESFVRRGSRSPVY